MSAGTSGPAAAERFAEQALALTPDRIPAVVRRRAEDLLVDVVGLCVAARGTDYMKSVLGALDASGNCTAIGHATTFGPEQAALVNGTAAHGEDFDDTFEGGPVHSSAVIAPAVLAVCERFGRDGAAALIAMVTGIESLCRLSMVIPKAIHKAGFHPTSILGTMGATLAASVAMGLDRLERNARLPQRGHCRKSGRPRTDDEERQRRVGRSERRPLPGRLEPAAKLRGHG